MNSRIPNNESADELDSNSPERYLRQYSKNGYYPLFKPNDQPTTKIDSRIAAISEDNILNASGSDKETLSTGWRQAWVKQWGNTYTCRNEGNLNPMTPEDQKKNEAPKPKR